MTIARLHSDDADFDTRLAKLLGRSEQADIEVEQAVAAIIKDVRRNGDDALFAYTKKFDQHQLTANTVEVAAERLREALSSIDSDQRAALEFAAKRIRAYHQHQLQQDWYFEEADGTRLGQKITAIECVGLYVPGGQAAYPSSVLMNAIPAKVAGVSQLIAVSPTPGGEMNPLVLAAASLAGIDRFFCVGGAQAIAALAYGTESVPRVDKITGPGNRYVAAAKRQVFGQVGIDMIAGPSEVLIIADDSVSPDWIAMDLFAQAEHDEMAQSILLTRDAALADAVALSIEKLLPEMPRADTIQASMSNNGALIVVGHNRDLIELSNRIAPEHLEIFTRDAEDLAQRVDHAGAIFIGAYSAESLGDYCAGPNHVLPTSGTARFSSPLGVYDFQKRSSILHISADGARTMGRQAAILAEGEALYAHARAAQMREQDKS